MSIFSIYTGLIYNECFSVPMAIFGRGHWACPGNPEAVDRVQVRPQPCCCMHMTIASFMLLALKSYLSRCMRVEH